MIAPLNPEIERYLASQERFEDLRRKTAMAAGRNLCDLAYANPYDGPPPAIRQAIRGALEQERALDLQYTPYGGATTTRRLVARKLAASHGERFGWRDIVMTPGAMAALNLLFRLVRRDGEPNEVIVVTPCWLDYPLYLANLGMTPVMVPPADDMTRFNLDAIAAALGPHTRAVIVSQPDNPLGTLRTPDDLEALAGLLDRSQTRPLLISDECHRDILFEPDRFTSPMAYYDATAIVYSFGKSLFMQGQRIGYAAVSPRMPEHEDVARRLEQLCRVMGFCTPTALMQIAVRDLLDEKPDLAPIAERRRRVLEALQSAGYEVIPSEATFFLYVRAPEADDFAFAERLAARSVLVLPSSVFHHPGWFRISLTGSDEMIEKALPVFAAAMAETDIAMEREAQ